MPDSMQADLALHPLLAQDDVRGIVFDLDGTIIDSAADIINGMRLTFQQAGLGTLPDDYFPDNLHGTSAGIMQSILADMGWPQPADFAPLKAQYVQHYASLGHGTTRLYADAQEVLSACRSASLAMGICTNKVHASALAATHKVGIHGLFDFISGSDTWAQAKPSPLPLLETIRMMGLAPEQCLYFGDTSVDAECAHAAGVRFVLHESGYGDQALKGMSRHFAFQQWGELLGDRPVSG
ncbi:HAD-IA family hydrolase [Alcaligenaceae bacterium]|nr:HAD-IA family hydrolase [Alcaligenaceae bacterium]